MEVLRGLGLRETLALVSSNGTVIRTYGSALLHRHHMPLAAARWLCGHANHFRSSLVFTFDLIAPDGREEPGALVMEERNDLQQNIGRWMEANRHAIHTVDDIHSVFAGDSPDNEPDKAPIQAMLCGPVARMREAEARLLEHPSVIPVGVSETHPDAQLTLHRTEYPDRDLSIVDILPAGCSKATAIARLAESQGITRPEILAIGDNWNDLPMLAFAGQRVVMGNAPADLQEYALTQDWSMGLSNDEDGVAHAIETALLLPTV
jgi:hydroxymethylpyrimidine pyrophosphatase-like HAD family hydrolase